MGAVPEAPMKIAFALVLLASAARALPNPDFDGKAQPPAPVPSAKAPAAAIDADDGRVWVTFEAPNKAQRQAAIDAGVSIEEVRPDTAAGFATPAALARAKKAGLKALSTVPLRARFGKLDFPEKDSIYHNYKEL